MTRNITFMVLTVFNVHINRQLLPLTVFTLFLSILRYAHADFLPYTSVVRMLMKDAHNVSSFERFI